MEEIKFKRPQLEDQELIRSYFQKAPSRSCERSFIDVYLWARHYQVTFAIIEDTLVFKGGDEKLEFSYPAGEEQNVKRALDFLMEYCESQKKEFRLYNVTQENFSQIEAWFPGEFELEYDRDQADYVYESEKLATLAGKKLHAKRNHINKFKKLYPNWSYERLNDDNVEECFQMALQWRNQNGCDEDAQKNAEMCVTLNALRLYKELDQKGGVLRVDGKVVAFTIGEELCEDTFVVHIEKAFSDIEGAYPMINQQFVEHEGIHYQYINREDDAGSEGLRKAKLSYRPVFLVEKGVVTRHDFRKNESDGSQ